MRTKRVKYDKGLFVIDEELEVGINSKAKEFVNDILYGIGKEYAIHDLEPLIMSAVNTEIADKAIDECAMQMMETIDKKENNYEI